VSTPTQAGPTSLPGDPAAVRHTAWSMTVYGDLLHDAGAGLARIDTTEGWSGPAADAFRVTYQGQPTAWLRAGDCFHDAAAALTRYADTLAWAQTQVAEAGQRWDTAVATTNAAADAHNRAMAVSRPAPSAPSPTPARKPGPRPRTRPNGPEHSSPRPPPKPPRSSSTPVTRHPRNPPCSTRPARSPRPPAGSWSTCWGVEPGAGQLTGRGDGQLGPAWEGVLSAKPGAGADIHTKPLDRIHILDGDPNDPTKGGHAPGTGRADKTEFPDTELWTDDHIITSVEDVARDPDRPPVLDPLSGNFRFRGVRDGVEIEGYVDPRGAVRTGYPVGGAGVTINDADGNPHPLTR
jgi:Bacterial EndoU nuclease